MNEGYPGYQFVLLRHGQSLWNLHNRFTGWTDVALTDQGRQEAHAAAKALRSAGITFDLAFTSVLQRARESLQIVIDETGCSAIPVLLSWRLNERHYGALQGLNKEETAQQLGQTLVMAWRRSYSERPPALDFNDPRHPRFDPLYAHLPADALPATESLQDTELRLLPLWRHSIVPAIQSGLRVLVVAHGNSLRALVRYLDQIPPQHVPELNIPTGLPLIYKTDLALTQLQRDYLPIE
jgi:2,3-bisphosphoglycerate-dependent phosphoglycerate mutase